MPKIQWTDLPTALREHLFERVRERKIRAEDLYALKLRRETAPDAPDGPWFKDVGSFKVCGEGKYPDLSVSNSPIHAFQNGLVERSGDIRGPILQRSELVAARGIDQRLYGSQNPAIEHHALTDRTLSSGPRTRSTCQW